MQQLIPIINYNYSCNNMMPPHRAKQQDKKSKGKVELFEGTQNLLFARLSDLFLVFLVFLTLRNNNKIK